MNYLIQRGKVRQQAINVPEGLPELLSDITREVLRCQPTKECLCQFIIDYLHSVIVAREKAMVAKSILDRALRQVDSIISDLCVCDLSNEKSNEMAQVIEDCFRNFLEKRRCEMRRGKETIKFADIDMLEELIMKCKFTEQELDSSRPAIESAYKRFVDAYMAAGKDTHGTELLYQYFRDRELKRIEENLRNKAATTIQAAFRGYLVRSMMAEHICVCTCRLEKQDQEELERMNNAARVIQRFFRYVLTRHDIKKMDDPCQEKETAPSKEETISAAAATDAAAVAESKLADVPMEAAPTTEPEDKSEPKPEEPKAEEVTAAPTEAAPAADSAPPPAEEASAPPAGDAAPPVEEAAPPAEEAAPPVEAAAPPAEAAAPPAEEAAPPAEADASPAEAAAPPAEAAPPPEEAAPPPEEAPPAEEVPVAE